MTEIKKKLCIFYTDYMESFQPGLNFSPVNRAEIASRLHGQFEPGLSFRAIFIPCSKQTRAEMSSRAEIIQYHEGQYCLFEHYSKRRLVDYLTCVRL